MHNWCFTVNNYTDEDVVAVKSLDYKYLVFGYEVGEQQTPHLQCYVEMTKRCRRGGIVKIVPRAAKVNPRYEKSTALQAATYCKKDGNYFEDGTISEERMHAGKAQPKCNKNANALLVLDAPTKQDALKLAKELMPMEWLLHSNAIEGAIAKHFKEPHKHRYKASDFLCPLLEDLTKAVLFWGKSGSGKTQFALAHFKNPLLVRHIDKLKEFSEENDGIVFDDMSFKHIPPEAVIHLLDMEEESTVHCRYQVGVIPRNVPRIFTHNTEYPFYTLSTIDKEQRAAIDRRLNCQECIQKLY